MPALWKFSDELAKRVVVAAPGVTFKLVTPGTWAVFPKLPTLFARFANASVTGTVALPIRLKLPPAGIQKVPLPLVRLLSAVVELSRTMLAPFRARTLLF